MASLTPNYNLRKPDKTGGVTGKGDLVDVTADISANMTIIDTELKAVSDTVDSLRHQGVVSFDVGTLTSVSYVDARSGATSPVGFTFIAPDSGFLTINFSGGLFNSGGTAFNCINVEVRSGGVMGSGSVLVNPSGDARALQYVGTGELKAGKSFRITNAVAGQTYNARFVYRTQSGTMTAKDLELACIPSP